MKNWNDTIRIMMLAKRIQHLLPSPTLSLNSRVKELERNGIPVINLSVGEPDMVTPSHILQAGKQAMDKGETHYTDVAGSKQLRIAISKRTKKDTGIFYTPEEIIVSCGAKHCLYNAFMALVDANDEVLIPIPVWSTYAEQIRLAGGKPVFIPLKEPFKLEAREVEKYYSQKTKLLILTSPNNPTGAIIEKNELIKIAAFAVQHNLIIISDEIYDHLYYTKQKPVSIASLGKDIKGHTVTINGVSKTYAMTGLRIGYAAGPLEIIRSMNSFQGQVTSNPCSISQASAEKALTASQNCVDDMQAEYEKRRAMVIKILQNNKQISFVPPEGAFYVFISVKNLLTSRYPTSTKWAEGLLQEKNVAVVPGEAFFAPGYVRISFSITSKTLKEGLKRIEEFINESKK